MRDTGSNPARKIQHEVLHHRQEENMSVVRCVFWQGTLENGLQSEGYYHNIDDSNLPGCYVVPLSVFYYRNTNKTTRIRDESAEALFAAEHVRFVFLEEEVIGLDKATILKDYHVQVPAPFNSARYGKLVPKKGLVVPASAVPDGISQRDEALKTMAGRNNLKQRREQAQAEFGNIGNPRKGIPGNSGPEFPENNTRWY